MLFGLFSEPEWKECLGKAVGELLVELCLAETIEKEEGKSMHVQIARGCFNPRAAATRIAENVWVTQSAGDGSEDYRSAQEIFDDCFSASTMSTSAAARKDSIDITTATQPPNSKDKQFAEASSKTAASLYSPIFSVILYTYIHDVRQIDRLHLACSAQVETFR